MAYPADTKMQGFDEERGSSDRSRLTGWMRSSSPNGMDDMRTRDAKMKKRLRVVRLIVRVATFILACFMLYSQIYMLQKYLSTRGIVRNGRNAWAKTTELWPTFLLLATSALTVLISGITIIMYGWGVKTANWHYQHVYGPWVGVEVAAHLAVWIGTVIGYRIGKTGNDLWGWSCDPKADAIQFRFEEVNFNFACNIQSDAWIVSIAQAALMLVVAVTWFLAYRRNTHKKKLNYRESLLLNSEYVKDNGHMLPGGNVPHPGV